jgi:exosortase/archaeosortase family protein
MSALYRLDLRFAAILAIYGAVIFLTYRDEVLGVYLAPLAVLTARLILPLIRQLGIDATREGALIAQPEGFAYEVAYTCTGFLPVLTYIVCVLAYPASWRHRSVGIALGAPLLWMVNVSRLVHLFYVGVFQPTSFRWAHEVAWEGLLAIAFVTLWMAWMAWSERRAKAAPVCARKPAS